MVEMSHNFNKQSAEVLDYDIDLVDWFLDEPTDDIDSVVVTISSTQEDIPTLVLGPGAHPDTTLIGIPAYSFKIWLGAGTNGVKYKVTSLVTTDQGRVKEVELYIKVRDK